MTTQSYQLEINNLNRNLKIKHTVFPEEIPTEAEWSKANKVSCLYVYPEPLFRARDMMKQYTQEDSYYSKIKKIINDIRKN